MNQKKKKKIATQRLFWKMKAFSCGFLEGVLILAFVRLCICQLISASGAVALTGSGSIKVVFGASICLCEMRQKRDGGRGAAAAAAAEGAVTSDSITTMAPVRLNRVPLCESERPACLLFPGSASERTAKCEEKLPGNNSFFFFFSYV